MPCASFFVDEILKKMEKSKLRQRGPKPKLSDAEVITIDARVLGAKSKQLSFWQKILNCLKQRH